MNLIFISLQFLCLQPSCRRACSGYWQVLVLEIEPPYRFYSYFLRNLHFPISRLQPKKTENPVAISFGASIIEGWTEVIQKVKKPKYTNKHTVWSISLKENGKWTSVWRKDQSKADELYRLLVKRMKSNGLGIDLKPTTLSQKQLEISQLCFNRLEANEFLKMDDDSTATKMLSAVDFFIQHY